MHPTKLQKTLISASVAALGMSLAGLAYAGDARSIALGGSVIANGHGVHGAMENPASLMAMKRRNERIHYRVGFAVELRDNGEVIDIVTDDSNEDLINDFETELDILAQQDVQCDPLLGAADDVCVDNTQNVAELSQRFLDILDSIDDETIDGRAMLDMGMAFTGPTRPVAVNLHFRGTVAGKPTVAEGDRDYIKNFVDILGPDAPGGTGQLTVQELQQSLVLEANGLGADLIVDQPEEILESEVQGGGLARAQLAISLANSFRIGEHLIDVGVTPKISSLTATDVNIRIRDEFEDGTPSIEDRLNDNEVEESSFTFDVGASMALPSMPVRVAAVLRNVVPESIKTNNNFKFETTPQLIVGALYERGKLSLNADLAVNEAKVDNFETQKMGIGLEYGTKAFAIRAGISADAARDNDATSFSLGLGLGPLQLGARLTEVESIEAGAQIAWSF